MGGTTDRVKVSFRRARARTQAIVFTRVTEVSLSLYFHALHTIFLAVLCVRPSFRLMKQAGHGNPFLGSVGESEFGGSIFRGPSLFGP